jgi:hypothetical protein
MKNKNFVFFFQLAMLLALNLLLSGCPSGSSETSDSTSTSVVSGAEGDDEGDAGSTPVPVPPPGSQIGDYSLTAWNDLGMHCMDGTDYSIFSILPPYNNLHAQLVDRKSETLVSQGVTLTYEAMEDPSGSINTTSASKTNFWSYVLALYGADLAPEMGLAGKPMASRNPVELDYRPDHGWFEAEGIPMTPFDDNGSVNFYPMVKVLARDSGGNLLAEARVVLPVSHEMNCAACHSSTNDTGNPALTAARPDAGWVFDSDPERDWKKNILRLHDEKQLGDADYQAALAAKGYEAAGLYASMEQNKPTLCASCHASNALPGTGYQGIAPLTQVLHASHGAVTNPLSGLVLNDAQDRGACYMCHPGAVTQCLRGAMGKATDSNGDAAMSCQSCHGSMAAVGSPLRAGWFDEPNCQSCHHDGQREVVGVDANGHPLGWSDMTFATNDDVPAAGYNLYRFSRGHGDLQCEACHGATHAVYPTSHDNDNLLSMDLQGHVGTVAECTVCHETMPSTTTGGPHGMHTMGQQWVERHGDIAEHNSQGCAYCHGSDYRGSFLSQIKTLKTFSLEDNQSISYDAGNIVSCYDCHNGPNGDDYAQTASIGARYSLPLDGVGGVPVTELQALMGYLNP